MDAKEYRINSWLDSPVDNDYRDLYYIENGNDNHSFCNMFASELIDIINSEAFTIKNKNQFRDDVIELIYKYSHEPR
jgi:hypothetical protein